MADITVNTDMSVNANCKFAGYITLTAHEALSKGDFLTINSDGEAALASKTDKVIGVCLRDASAGAPVTVFGSGTHIVNFASGMTPGAVIYLSNDNAGAVTATKPVTAIEVAIAVSATDVMVLL